MISLFCICFAAITPMEIVVPDRAHPGERFAAEEIQNWVGRMTGRFIPVETVKSESSGGEKIYVGAEFAKKRFSPDFKAIGSSDGFAVRSAESKGAQCVFVFGTQPKGTLHAAYALLERNSDIIWPRPDPKFEAVYSKCDSFSIANADFREIPKTMIRDWQWNHMGKRGAPSEFLWGSRNRLNRNGGADSQYASCFVGGGKGHGIQKYANPSKNFTIHPEWFPEIDGERTYAGGQVCMTADGLAEEMYSNIVNELSLKYPGTPPARIKVDYFSLTCADNHRICECRRCLEPLDCGNGISIGIDDPAFRSAQYYKLINKVAKLLAKTHPRVVIGTYAYALTRHAPPFELERNVSVELCLTGHDERASLNDISRNEAGFRWTEQWSRKCRNLWIRTYCGWSGRNYRAIEYGYVASGRYAAGLKNPVTQYSAELKRDDVYDYGSEVWDSSGMSYWIISRLWWDPFQDVDALRRMYIDRTYREAAPAMRRFFDLFRDAYEIDRMPATYRITGPAFMTRHYLYETGVGDRLVKILDEALAAARHPVSRAMIERQKKRLCANLALAAALPEAKIKVRSLASGWETADETSPFVNCAGIYGMSCDSYGGVPEVKTTVKALYDDKALYLRFICEAPDAKTIYGISTTGDPEDQPHCDDAIEFFICRPDTGVYWQWIMDPGARDGRDVVYDARGDNAKWKGNWTKSVERTDSAWILTMRIPFADMEFESVPKSLRFNAFRARMPLAPVPDAKKGRRIRHRRSSWTGAGVHDSGGFGLLEFE